MAALKTSAPIGREAYLKQFSALWVSMTTMSRHVVMNTSARSQYEPRDPQMPVCLGPVLIRIVTDESHCYSVLAQGADRDNRTESSVIVTAPSRGAANSYVMPAYR